MCRTKRQQSVSEVLYYQTHKLLMDWMLRDKERVWSGFCKAALEVWTGSLLYFCNIGDLDAFAYVPGTGWMVFSVCMPCPFQSFASNIIGRKKFIQLLCKGHQHIGCCVAFVRAFGSFALFGRCEEHSGKKLIFTQIMIPSNWVSIG